MIPTFRAEAVIVALTFIVEALVVFFSPSFLCFLFLCSVLVRFLFFIPESVLCISQGSVLMTPKFPDSDLNVDYPFFFLNYGYKSTPTLST